MKPATTTETKLGRDWRERLGEIRRSWGAFLLFVILPCVVVGGYLYLVAADQYKSEAHYLIRAQSTSPTPPSSGLSALLGATGSVAAHSEAATVADYLTSHDVVQDLRKSIDMVAIFRRPEADLLSRMRQENPRPEELLKYYRSQVDVYLDKDTGITNLSVRAFRSGDAQAIARALLALGEARVNEMNERGYADAVTNTRRQLTEAERTLAQVQVQMTAFRQSERDVDPVGSADAQIVLVSRLTGEVSAARAELATVRQAIGVNNPQFIALSQQVRSLEAQLAAQSGRLAGGGDTIASGLGDYERLRMQQEFLAKRYEAAAAAYELSRQQALRQQLYLVRVVDANTPVKSLYPERATILITLLAVLLVAYGIGWLIVAGVKEHAH